MGLALDPADLRARYLADGSWTDETFAAFIDHRAAAAPDLRVRIWSDDRPCTTTVAELHRQAARLAAGLAARGVGPGDVIAYQMPNWAETLAVLWAGFRIGATMVPIIHFYGPQEVRFIVRQSGARALVIPPASAAQPRRQPGRGARRPRQPGDRRRGRHGRRGPSVPGGVALDDLVAADPMTEPAPVDPDAPAMVGYTSGTTADPKGVVHSHRTLLAEVRQLAALETSWAAAR